MSTIYLVHTAFIDTKRSNNAVFTLVIFRPRIAGGNLTIPIDSSVRLVKCSRREASHNTIRLRYGHDKDRRCIVMRAIDSLEREKWLVGLIQAMAAAGPCSTGLQTSSEASLHTSDDTVSSSADHIDDICMTDRQCSSASNVCLSATRVRNRVTVAFQFLASVSHRGATK